jgi:LEA14-like dessication related protein
MRTNYVKNTGCLLALLISCIAISSCKSIKPVEITNVSKLEINANKPTEAHVSAVIELNNPNNFELLIRAADIDVYIQGIYLGKLEIPDSLHLQKKGRVNTKFKVKIKTSALLAIGMNVLSGVKDGYFEMQFKGTFYSEFLWFKRNIKIDRKEKVQLK